MAADESGSSPHCCDVGSSDSRLHLSTEGAGSAHYAKACLIPQDTAEWLAIAIGHDLVIPSATEDRASYWWEKVVQCQICTSHRLPAMSSYAEIQSHNLQAGSLRDVYKSSCRVPAAIAGSLIHLVFAALVSCTR